MASLDPKLRDLVAKDRHARPPVGRLTDAQVQALAAVATRRGPRDDTVSAARAIAALAKGAPAADVLPVTQAVLADESAPQADKIAASRALGQLATSGAERVILEHVGKPAPRVQQELLAALGTFASPKAAPALAALTVGDDPAVRRQLAYTQALLAHRHALDGPFLEPRAAAEPPPQPDGATELSVAVKPAQAAAADRKKLVGSTFGVPFAARALGLKCGPADWTIFLNESIGPTAKELAPSFQRPLLAGVAAQRYPGGERLETRMTVLTRPAGDGVRVELVRADGAVMYAGSAKRSGADVTFTITDAEGSGAAPTRLTGAVTARGVELRSSAVSPTRRSGRTAKGVTA